MDTFFIWLPRRPIPVLNSGLIEFVIFFKDGTVKKRAIFFQKQFPLGVNYQ